MPVFRRRYSGARCDKGSRSSPRRIELAADAEALDQFLVPRLVYALDVVEQAAAGLHQLEQAAAGMVVLAVRLEMLGEVVDALREDRNLHFRRAGIVRLGGIFLDARSLALGRDRHRVILSKGGFEDARLRDVVQGGPLTPGKNLGLAGHIGQLWRECQWFCLIRSQPPRPHLASPPSPIKGEGNRAA